MSAVQGSGLALLENVVVRGDLANLPEADRLTHYKNVCESLGLNPLTKPFDYITLNGKMVLYAKRDCTDQLRKRHNVSISIVSREKLEDVYVVTARASMPGDRWDESVGAVSLKNLSGDALCNAIMKAETKAKRRVTLSICGLGLLDEIEIEAIPGTINPETGEIRVRGNGLDLKLLGKALNKLREDIAHDRTLGIKETWQELDHEHQLAAWGSLTNEQKKAVKEAEKMGTFENPHLPPKPAADWGATNIYAPKKVSELVEQALPEKLPEGLGEEDNSPPATDSQKKLIYARIKNAGATADEFATAFGTKVSELTMEQVNPALAVIEKWHSASGNQLA